MRTILIEYDDKQKQVAFDDFVKQSTKMLRDFGFPNATEDEVKEQVEAILQGKPLNMYGTMLHKYIIK